LPRIFPNTTTRCSEHDDKDDADQQQRVVNRIGLSVRDCRYTTDKAGDADDEQRIRGTKDELPCLATRGQDTNQRSPQPDQATANPADQPGTATANPLPGRLQRIFTAGVLIQTDVFNRHRACAGKNE
jgi:hypothetical protein